MAQHDYVIANGTGAAVRSDLNNGLSAIVTQNSGATEPATTYAFMRWADTTAGVMKMRNSANNAWITLYQLDGEWTNIAFENGTAAAPSIYFKDSGTDTGFYSPGANQVGISTGGTARLTIDSNGNVDIDSNTLYVDAANNRVGLGTSTPGGLFHVGPSGAGVVIDNTYSELSPPSSGNDSYLFRSSNDGSLNFSSRPGGGGRSYRFWRGSNVSMIIDDSGRVGIGTTSVSELLHLNGASAAIQVQDSGATNSIGKIINSGGILYIQSQNNTSHGQIVFRTSDGSATERARIDSSGRLLVGTSSDFGSGSTGDKLQVATSAGGHLLTGRDDSSVVVDENMGLWRGYSYGGSVWEETARISMQADGAHASGDKPGRLVFSTTKDGSSSPSERMRINNLGNTMINSTSVTDFAALTIKYHSSDSSNQPATGIAIDQSNAATGTLIGFRNSSGTVIGTITNNNNGTVTYNNSSDYRLKENIVALTGATERVQQLKPSQFNFIGFPDKTVDGFIAHEAQAVVPECVTGEKDAVDDDGNPIYQGIDHSKLVPLLTAALQEAIGRIETLEAEVAALKGL